MRQTHQSFPWRSHTMVMPPPDTTLRTRPLAMGHLRTFAAVARHLNFRAASDELALTQSAVSRQIQALEDEVGVSLFLRHTRAVELTAAGAQLLQAVLPALERMDHAVRQIRRSAGRKSVAISTWASFASMWLIPRLEAFQSQHPDIDIRVSAHDALADLDDPETAALLLKRTQSHGADHSWSAMRARAALRLRWESPAAPGEDAAGWAAAGCSMRGRSSIAASKIAWSPTSPLSGS